MMKFTKTCAIDCTERRERCQKGYCSDFKTNIGQKIKIFNLFSQLDPN